MNNRAKKPYYSRKNMLLHFYVNNSKKTLLFTQMYIYIFRLDNSQNNPYYSLDKTILFYRVNNGDYFRYYSREKKNICA